MPYDITCTLLIYNKKNNEIHFEKLDFKSKHILPYSEQQRLIALVGSTVFITLITRRGK